MISQTENISCLKNQIYAYIQDLVALNERRNCGIGTKLMAASKEYGKNMELSLFVFPFFRKTVPAAIL